MFFNWLLFNIPTINFIYAVAGLGVLAATVVLFFDYFCNEQRLYRRFVASYVWLLIMVTSIGGVATTLLYSEVLGFIPCSLCWLQRVALYPQALLSIAAFTRKDALQFPVYGMVLSGFGLIVAIYHYIYQAIPDAIEGSSIMPCLADGTADCADKVLDLFGFVTFPFLSGVLFLFLIVLYLHMRKLAHASSD